MTVQTMNVLTVPFTCPLHIGHFLIAGAQSEQQTRWPHGRNAMDALKSKHILHNLWSFSCLFSSTKNSASEI